MDYGVCEGPGTNSPQIQRDNLSFRVSKVMHGFFACDEIGPANLCLHCSRIECIYLSIRVL